MYVGPHTEHKSTRCTGDDESAPTDQLRRPSQAPRGPRQVRRALSKGKVLLPARDREKLLAVVEAGYGDMQPFNKQVRHILDKNSEGGQVTFQDDDDEASGSASGVQPSSARGGVQPHGIPIRV